MNSNKALTFLMVVIVFVCIYLIYRVSVLESQLAEQQPEKSHDFEHSDVHLGERMSKLFYFHQKLGTSIKHKNNELSHFYLHEIEESVSDMIKEEIVDEGVNVSQLLKTMMVPEIEKLEEVLENGDSTVQYSQYLTMISTCNSCHKLSKHPFIVVKPVEKIVEGQDFNPL